MKFFSIPNLSSNSTVEFDKPWEWKPPEPPPYPTSQDTYDDFMRWRMSPTTQHAFLSTYEGTSAGVRVTGGQNGNRPFQLHGLMVDYDSKSPDQMAEHVKKTAPVPYLPQWLVHTARDHSRLVWFFERPLMLASDELAKLFLKKAVKELKLAKWAAGFDADAFGDPTKYYEIGKRWEPLFVDAVIPAALTEAWLLDAVGKVQLNKEQTLKYKIPMEDLSAEMHRRFPGRWRGDLYDGARGVRFWDPSADNETAAVVTEEGMICFTGNRPFVSWENIFGKAFVAQYEADYVAHATENTAYDGKNFWVCHDGDWSIKSKEDFAQMLRVKGFDGSRPRGKTFSEIDQIEYSIKETRSVVKALPFMYYPTGIIEYKGLRYMNTSRVRVLQPAAPYAPSPMVDLLSGEKEFPFLYKFFTSLFSENEDPHDKQLIAFLSWVKYFYQSSYEQRPGPGQALVLAGDAGKGKTFFNRAVLGSLMGSRASGDATAHLVDGAQWTDSIADSPIMAIDDAIAAGDYRDLSKFTQRIKRYVANATVSYNAKYGQTGDVPWFGRVVITCNLDPESLRILPGMDQSTRDKIMLFKTSPVKVKFKSWAEMDKVIARELPMFARFLLEWPMPEHRISPEARFYVKPYHHRELFEEALHQSADGVTTEVLVHFLEQYFEQYPGKDAWFGSGVLLHQDMSEVFPETMRTIRPRQLATCLGNLKKNGFCLENRRERKGRLWVIPRQFLDEQQNGLREEEESE